jgi:AcrR family transcriptional regulator
VAAAAEVVARHGTAGFSARAVAAAGGLPLAAVSYYFPRLDDLLSAAVDIVLRGWIEHGHTVAADAAASGRKGIDAAATVIARALLPPGPPSVIAHRYRHLLAGAAHPDTAAALAALRSTLEALVCDILATTGVKSPLSSDVIVALVDGAAVGAIAEGRPDPAGVVQSTLRAALRAANQEDAIGIGAS